MTITTRYTLILTLALAGASCTATVQPPHQGTGVVKKVDAAKGTVTLAHDPIKSLKWPAMTMDFQVRDQASLAKLMPEQKIQFELVQHGKDYVITAVK